MHFEALCLFSGILDLLEGIVLLIELNVPSDLFVLF